MVGSVVGMASQDKAVDAIVSRIASTLNRRLTSITADVSHVLSTEIPELRADNKLLELLAASVESNVDTIFHTLQHDIAPGNLDAPAAATEYARRLSQHAVPVNALVRAYRLGQSTLFDLFFEEVRNSDVNPELTMDVLQRIITVVSAYIDRVSQQVVDIYERERERWLANQSSIRAVRVQDILAGNAPADVGEALNYSLDQEHLAAIVWIRDNDSTTDQLFTLEAAGRDIAQFLQSSGGPLFVASDRVTGWLWVPLGVRSSANPDARYLSDYLARRHKRLAMAIGELSYGTSGFRRSHLQARKARALAIAAEGNAPLVTAYTEPAVSTLSMLVENMPATREWVIHVLRGLAKDNEHAARLRETLRVYLASGSSNTAAGEIMNLHYNSVKYRIKRAVEERGRDFRTDRVDVELALLACQWLGSAVLDQDLGADADSRRN